MLTNAQLFVYASAVRHRVRAVQTYAHQTAGESRVKLAVEELTEQETETIELLGDVASTFASLNLSKRQLDDRWPVLGGPERELHDFMRRSEPLREGLADPRGLLPSYAADRPFVLEMRATGDAKAEMQWAYLEAPLG